MLSDKTFLYNIPFTCDLTMFTMLNGFMCLYLRSSYMIDLIVHSSHSITDSVTNLLYLYISMIEFSLEITFAAYAASRSLNVFVSLVLCFMTV